VYSLEPRIKDSENDRSKRRACGVEVKRRRKRIIDSNEKRLRGKRDRPAGGAVALQISRVEIEGLSYRELDLEIDDGPELFGL
jgi:hypothetical protein